MPKEISATVANMEKLYPKYGNSLVQYSPYTGETYSANPSDYFMAQKRTSFKDTTGHVMRLVVRGGMKLTIPIEGKGKIKHPRARR